MSDEPKMVQMPRRCAVCGGELPAGSDVEICSSCQAKSATATLRSRKVEDTGPGPRSKIPAKPMPNPGELFGQYRLGRVLGEGGMGVVYEAEDTESGRRLALKVLSEGFDSLQARKRFLREGRVAASVNHPNSVYVFGTDEIDGTPVIAMELMGGGTLRDRIDGDGPMPPAEAVDSILQVIAGLEAAQQFGILHRDIKPSNCFVETNGAVKIGDFGLSSATSTRAETQLTTTGTIFGTPIYSSPEQLRGEELTVCADIYSLGVTLYFLLTGRKPFEGTNVVQLLATVLERKPESPAKWKPNIPEGLCQVVLRCLEKDPGARFQSYARMREALLPYASAKPVPATLGMRMLAALVDSAVVSVPWLMMAWLIFGSWEDVTQSFLPSIRLLPHETGASSTANSILPGAPAGELLRWAEVIAAGLLIGVLYFGLLEGRRGASLGKLLCGLRVTRTDRNAPGLGWAMLRHLIVFVTVVVPLAFLTWRQLPSPSEAAAEIEPVPGDFGGFRGGGPPPRSGTNDFQGGQRGGRGPRGPGPGFEGGPPPMEERGGRMGEDFGRGGPGGPSGLGGGLGGGRNRFGGPGGPGGRGRRGGRGGGFRFLAAPIPEKTPSFTPLLERLAIALLSGGLLFCCARRRNGFAGLQDLATRSQVLARESNEGRPLLALADEELPDTKDMAQLGPYYILKPLGQSGDEEMVLGFDARLLRKIWIRKLKLGAPGLSPLRAGLARPGRLRWLNSHRSATDAWDVYEAAAGRPLLSLTTTPQDWGRVRFWLLDLAEELKTAEKEGTLPAILDLDRVWITATGHAKILDFPAPGVAGMQISSPPGATSPAAFLRQVAASTLQGRALTAAEARASGLPVPMPLHAREFVGSLNEPSDLGSFLERLKPLLSVAASVSRARRFGVLALSVSLPTVATVAFVMALWVSQERQDYRQLGADLNVVEEWSRWQTNLARLKNTNPPAVFPALRNEQRTNSNPGPPGGGRFFPQPNEAQRIRMLASAQLRDTAYRIYIAERFEFILTNAQAQKELRDLAPVFVRNRTNITEICQQLRLTETNRDVQFIWAQYHLWMPVKSSPSTFTDDDIKDAPALAKKLVEGSDPVSQFLEDRFSPFFREYLFVSLQSSTPPAALRTDLARNLTRIVFGDSLLETNGVLANPFAGVKLRPATLRLAKTNPQGDELAKLNRMLLEDAYPRELARSSWTLMPNFPDLATQEGRHEAREWIMLFAYGSAILLVALPALLTAFFFGGGAILRLQGIAVVAKDGTVSRIRSVLRWLLAWLPFLLWPLLAHGLEAPLGGLAEGVFVSLALIIALGVVSTMLPGRGLPDRLAGTWRVPR